MRSSNDFISHIKNIQTKKSLLCYDFVVFETEHSELPNFYSFNKNFGLNVQELIMKSKGEVNKICNSNYDRFWSGKISQSPKATSFIKFRITPCIKFEHKVQKSYFSFQTIQPSPND